MIEPTVGRVVHYYPHANELEGIAAPPAPGQPLAAMIAAVQSSSVINLHVSDANGTGFGRTGVHLVQDGETPPQGAYAEWMDYQKGQAAKTEQTAAQSLEPVRAKVAELAQKVEQAPASLHEKFAELETSLSGKIHDFISGIEQRLTPAAAGATAAPQSTDPAAQPSA